MNSPSCSTAQLQLMLNPQLIEAERQRRRSAFLTLFPDTGPFCREHYPKHLEFFAAGTQYKERLFMAANRVGKTVAGAFEATCHLTGRYPSWWAGKRFAQATDGWACGATSQTTRDILQGVLLGKSTGQGMIPIDAIVDTVAGRSISGSIETVRVKHMSGATSKLGFKTYEQGRRAFEGEAKDLVWCDEEPPMDVYVEILFRLLTTKGLVWTTFTPLLGMSEMVSSFLEPEAEEAVPVEVRGTGGLEGCAASGCRGAAEAHRRHACLPDQSAHRWGTCAGRRCHLPDRRGRDSGAGPSHPGRVATGLRHGRGLESHGGGVGGAGSGSGVIYLYSEHYQGQGEPASHAQAIRGRGEWIPRGDRPGLPGKLPDRWAHAHATSTRISVCISPRRSTQ